MVGLNLQDQTTGNAGTKVISSLRLGADGSGTSILDGAIGELIITSENLTDEEITSWDDYLIRKLDVTL